MVESWKTMNGEDSRTFLSSLKSRGFEVVQTENRPSFWGHMHSRNLEFAKFNGIDAYTSADSFWFAGAPKSGKGEQNTIFPLMKALHRYIPDVQGWANPKPLGNSGILVIFFLSGSEVLVTLSIHLKWARTKKSTYQGQDPEKKDNL